MMTADDNNDNDNDDDDDNDNNDEGTTTLIYSPWEYTWIPPLK